MLPALPALCRLLFALSASAHHPAARVHQEGGRDHAGHRAQRDAKGAVLFTLAN